MFLLELWPFWIDVLLMGLLAGMAYQDGRDRQISVGFLAAFLGGALYAWPQSGNEILVLLTAGLSFWAVKRKQLGEADGLLLTYAAFSLSPAVYALFLSGTGMGALLLRPFFGREIPLVCVMALLLGGLHFFCW